MSSTEPLLAVITPVSRPWLLPQVAASLAFLAPWVGHQWFPIVDDQGPDEGGARKRNVGVHAALTSFPSAWIYQLDDDNIVSPSFAKGFVDALAQQPNAELVLFPNIVTAHGRPHGTAGLRRLDQVSLGKVDTAQYVVRGSLIRELRYTPCFETDFVYLRSIADLLEKPIVAVAENAFVTYNALR